MLQNTFLLIIYLVLGRNVTTANRTLCDPSDPPLPNRINTTQILHELRLKMTSEQIQAFIATSHDEHQCEFVAPSGKRIQFISGFSGSAGTAVVTANKSVLWTDGRYHIQADNEMDCNWTLMRSGLPNVPEIDAWLRSEFPNGGKIGADPKLIPAATWHKLEDNLNAKNGSHKLVKTYSLIDAIWKNKPQEPIKQAFVLDKIYSGEDWQQKVNRTRSVLKSLGADAMVATALDEISWLLNIRGYDTPFTPLVKSYVLLSQKDVTVFMERSKVPFNFSLVHEPKGQEKVKYMEYEDIWSFLPVYMQPFKKALVPIAYGYNPGTSKEIHDLVPIEKRLLSVSPIIDLMAVKNPTEIKGIENAHVKDAVALCEFFEYFEKNQTGYDEIQVAELVNQFRFKQPTLFSPSFDTISAYGPNSAQPHYIPTKETSVKILNGSLLLIDSGGQYLDGTTDVTRTISIGNPTIEHKEAYTRVLMGAIELSALVFPNTLNTSQVDLLARAPLWEIGYSYLHGTGHGIGSFLLVHESPINIMYSSKKATILKAGQFTSIEPGIYLEDKFGVRLENVAKVVNKTNLKFNFGGPYIGFEDVTLVPYDTNLIDFNLLSRKHIKWLQEYYRRMFDKIGAELKLQKKYDAYNWLFRQVEMFNYEITSFRDRRFKQL